MTRYAASALVPFLATLCGLLSVGSVADSTSSTTPYGALLLRQTSADGLRRTPGTPASSAKATLNESHQKITNGQAALEGEFPWMVAFAYIVNNELKQYCGGTLIATNWAVTAAHCPLEEGDLVIWGTVDVEAGSKHPAHIAKIKRGAFSSKTFDSDYALVMLDQSIPVIPIDRGSAADYGTKEGNPIIIVGWGRTDPQDSKSQSHVLLKADVHSADFMDCKNIYAASPDTGITATMFCANSRKSATCIGDSGGPALRPAGKPNTYELVGIISWGQDCTQRAWPGVYTRIEDAEELFKANGLPPKQPKSGESV